MQNNNTPDSPHQAVDKELILLRRRLSASVPHLGVAALHEPPLKIHGMPDKWVLIDLVRGEREGLESGVEVGDAVLGEETDEVQAADGEFALGGREDRAIRRPVSEECITKWRGFTCNLYRMFAVVRSSGRRRARLWLVYSRMRRFRGCLLSGIQLWVLLYKKNARTRYYEVFKFGVVRR